ncbi:hypothetical protein XENTR_v10018651 [Xenopus tropicalis]|nr:hypothetical protein XENTR_v10018651 [Xenopus tropicalis]
MKLLHACQFLLLCYFICITDCASFRFASYYASHMVLQQKPSQAVIWGYGEVGAAVTVSLFNGSDTISKKSVPINDDAGVWKVLLDPVDHGGPYWLLAQQRYQKDITDLALHDLLFGDVWLCSGQSNMEMTVSQVFNASEELAKAADYPTIRLFTAALEVSLEELDDLAKVDLQWSAPTPENLGNGEFTYFSAVCWLFGRHLSRRLKYPIGLVESVWGGTPVEAWSSKRALQKCGLSQHMECASSRSMYAGPCNYTVLWNAMIHPLLNMTIKGAIWYQGKLFSHSSCFKQINHFLNIYMGEVTRHVPFSSTSSLATICMSPPPSLARLHGFFFSFTYAHAGGGQGGQMSCLGCVS